MELLIYVEDSLVTDKNELMFHPNQRIKFFSLNLKRIRIENKKIKIDEYYDLPTLVCKLTSFVLINFSDGPFKHFLA